MSTRTCNIVIDNSQNSGPLTLSSIQGLQGVFSPALAVGDVIAAQAAAVTYTLTNTSIWHGADALLTWTTGPDNSVALQMLFQNVIPDTGQDGNEASLTIASATATPSAYLNAYATAYMYAGQGSSAVMTRDYVPNTGSDTIPLNVNFYVVENAFASSNPGTFLPRITKVVLLMLENRSLDHLLGQLYTDSDGPAGFYPSPGNPATYSGLGEPPLTKGNSLPDSFQKTVYALSDTDAPTTPDPDPGEDFENVRQQLFYADPPGGGPPLMMGFLDNYRSQLGVASDAQAAQIMGYYPSTALPVLSGLARQYAVSDAWFASVPTQTYANRAFSIAGTSSGSVDNDDLPNPPGYQMRTLFNVLMDADDYDWAIYSQDDYWIDSCFITFEFEAMDTPAAKKMVQNQNMDQICALAKAGNLPSFSYIEPMWYGGSISEKWNGNDYHPVANLLPGEQALYQLYQALTQSSDWNSTLLIVTFDEHGGTYDHVSPPAATPPDGQTAQFGSTPFDFSSLGVRVPTLLISPLISAGTVFRSPEGPDGTQFDHTSLVRTLLGWRGIDVSGGVMGARAAVAPDFSGVLSSSVVNPGCVSITPRSVSAEAQALNADRPLNGLQRELTFGLAHSLSGDVKGGAEHQRIWQDLKRVETMGELREYVTRAKAARAARAARGPQSSA